MSLVHRKLTADVTEKIEEIEEKLSTVASESKSMDSQLNDLELDAKNVDSVVKTIAEQLELMKNSDIRG